MGGQERYYNKNYVPNPQNRNKRRKGVQVEAPKWSRYCFYGKEKIWNIPVYDKSIFCFTIMEKNTRFILGSWLKQKPNAKISRYPVWFDSRPCLKEAISKYGLPYGLITDGLVIEQCTNGKNYLEGIEAVVRAETPHYIASLEAFFGILQREMRTELTQENLNKYVEFWNNQRVLSTLGKTPKQLWKEIEFL
jgi:hypothetical protein